MIEMGKMHRDKVLTATICGTAADHGLLVMGFPQSGSCTPGWGGIVLNRLYAVTSLPS